MFVYLFFRVGRFLNPRPPHRRRYIRKSYRSSNIYLSIFLFSWLLESFLNLNYSIKILDKQNLTEFFTIFSNSLIFYDSFTDQQFKKNLNQWRGDRKVTVFTTIPMLLFGPNKKSKNMLVWIYFFYFMYELAKFCKVLYFFSQIFLFTILKEFSQACSLSLGQNNFFFLNRLSCTVDLTVVI